MSNISPQIRIRVKKMISIANLFRLKEINEAEALDSLLSTIDGFKKFTWTQVSSQLRGRESHNL